MVSKIFGYDPGITFKKGIVTFLVVGIVGLVLQMINNGYVTADPLFISIAIAVLKSIENYVKNKDRL